MTTHYNRIGGAEKLSALVTRFYRNIDELPESHGVRQMHPDNWEGSQDKLFKYLCASTGGPAQYVQQYGHPNVQQYVHPMLRRRYLTFSIGDSGRDPRMPCMNSVLRDEVEGANLRRELSTAFPKVAGHMRSKPQ